MTISKSGIAILGALICLLYLWPATARTGRPLIVAFGVAALTLLAFWTSAYVGPIAMEQPRGLAAAIDLALRWCATSYVLAAITVQMIRRWAQTRGISTYRHWIAVTAGAVLAPVPVILFI